MCNGSFNQLDAAFNFATRYSKSCKVPLHLLFNKGEPEFLDLYIPYEEDGGLKLHAIPILIRNNGDNREEKDDSRWSLTSRIFLVDAVSGIPVRDKKEGDGPEGSLPELVRYMSRLSMTVDVVNARERPGRSGKIYPPVVAVEYAVAESRDIGKEVEFHFDVEYRMDLKEGKRDIEVRKETQY